MNTAQQLEKLRKYFADQYDQSVRSSEDDHVNGKLEKLMALALEIWEEQ